MSHRPFPEHMINLSERLTMPRSTTIQRAVRAALLTVLTGVVLLLSSGSFAQARTRSRAVTPRPTIVLVHGAWASGSSWDGVIWRLQREGYTVDAPPNPLRGLASDSAYLASYLNSVTGPIILVGHSYGGAVITNAATGNANVKALVYVDGFIPAQGDTLLGLSSAMPGSTLGDPATAFNFVPFTDAAGSDTDLFLKPSVFRADFGADLSVKKDAVLAATQEPLAASALQQPSGPPAWATIRSYDIFGTKDMVLPPAEQAFMAHRAHATVVRIPGGSHLTLISHAGAVARFIEQAAVRSR
jgi:pimeloyl-ACP methyl ester carboxylesterase